MAIDLRKLPPLKALKGFEAAARLQSIRGAADELNLTHPAISHQIHTLEDDLGVKLFARQGRNVVLTPAGEALYPSVRAALELLIKGCETVREQSANPALRLQAYITLSIRWLAGRLSDFRCQYPDIDIHLQANNSAWEFDEANADIGLIYSRTEMPSHLHWIRLFPSQVYPVCAPQLLQDAQLPLTPEALENYPLLTVSTEKGYWGWDEWFMTLGTGNQRRQSPLVVDTLAVALEMAIAGQGIALVNGPVAEDDLAAGRLIRPVNEYTAGNGEWGIAVPKALLNDTRVMTFINWLKQQAGNV
ncbi:LysR substrate-binding domain-containing protein [Aliamphritea spongicola]|uniref:LysR substrate-binding domain-containing protein n=1 Tax=Aliamphritea spongicola TaxID=707589 RepID=UPI00196B9AB4|nr:LysR substrate-binding domain-containing protein [Aliamphritea spongicola]MBN3564386.1 LysR family transcriptional regulator [Aliamphritea spongicola]